MDYFDILISINKISIVFFAITVLFILFEFYLYSKEKRRSQNTQVETPNATLLKQMSEENPLQVAKKPNNKILIIAGIAVIFFGLIFAASYFVISKKQTQEGPTTVLPTIKPTAKPTISPTQTPIPTESLIAEEEPIPASPSPTIEEIIVAEVSPTETPQVEEVQAPEAGSSSYTLFIFAASIILILVAFAL